MPILSREEILKANDIEIKLIDVPEWGKGAQVYVRGMTGAERDRFESSIIETKGKNQNVNLANVRAKLASLTICNEAGKALFTEADVKELSGKSAAALQRVFEVAQKLSGLGQDDIEHLTEGIEESPFGGSASD